MKENNLPELPDDDSELRRLALQFDGHRMQAIWHLKAMLADAQPEQKG